MHRDDQTPRGGDQDAPDASMAEAGASHSGLPAADGTESTSHHADPHADRTSPTTSTSSAALAAPKRGWFQRTFRPTAFDQLETEAEEVMGKTAREEKDEWKPIRHPYKEYNEWCATTVKKHLQQSEKLEKSEVKASEEIVKDELDGFEKIVKALKKAKVALPTAAAAAPA